GGRIYFQIIRLSLVALPQVQNVHRARDTALVDRDRRALPVAGAGCVEFHRCPLVSLVVATNHNSAPRPESETTTSIAATPTVLPPPAARPAGRPAARAAAPQPGPPKPASTERARFHPPLARAGRRGSPAMENPVSRPRPSRQQSDCVLRGRGVR